MDIEILNQRIDVNLNEISDMELDINHIDTPESTPPDQSNNMNNNNGVACECMNNNNIGIHPFKLTFNERINERNKRFGQVYPLPYQYCGFLFPEYNEQWTTFISPAILPLTNDIEFQEEILECSATVYKSNWGIGITNDNYTLNEMVYCND